MLIFFFHITNSPEIAFSPMPVYKKKFPCLPINGKMTTLYKIKFSISSIAQLYLYFKYFDIIINYDKWIHIDYDKLKRKLAI